MLRLSIIVILITFFIWFIPIIVINSKRQYIIENYDINHMYNLSNLYNVLKANTTIELDVEENVIYNGIWFPNDLLWELDKMEFYIPETGETVKGEAPPDCDHHLQRGEGAAGCLPAPLYLPLYCIPGADDDGEDHQGTLPGSRPERCSDGVLDAFYRIRDLRGSAEETRVPPRCLDWIQALCDRRRAGGEAGQRRSRLRGYCLKKTEDLGSCVENNRYVY